MKDADSLPTVAVRKNGAAVGDSVTVTKRSASTGIYDCSYNPAGEVEGDSFTLEESATVTGTTTPADTYTDSFVVCVVGSAAAAAVSAASADAKLTAGRLGKLDSLTFTTPNVVDASGGGGGGGGTDWTADERAQIRHQLGIDGTATAPTAPVTSPVVIVPSGAGKTTCYALCVDRRGDPKAGVAVHCWLAKTRPAGLGIIADDLVEVFTSGGNGVVQVPDRMLGFSYAFAIGGTANPIVVRISPTAGETTAIPDLIS